MNSDVRRRDIGSVSGPLPTDYLCQGRRKDAMHIMLSEEGADHP